MNKRIRNKLKIGYATEKTKNIITIDHELYDLEYIKKVEKEWVNRGIII